MQRVFDGHNDVLLRLWENARRGEDPIKEFIGGTDNGHIDLPRSRKGGLAGGICAIYISSGEHIELGKPDANGHYQTPLSPRWNAALPSTSPLKSQQSPCGWKLPGLEALPERPRPR